MLDAREAHTLTFDNGSGSGTINVSGVSEIGSAVQRNC